MAHPFSKKMYTSFEFRYLFYLLNFRHKSNPEINESLELYARNPELNLHSIIILWIYYPEGVIYL